MYRFGHPTRAGIKRDVRALIRTFPDRSFVRIKRQLEKFDDIGAPIADYETIYEGEALMRPGSGTSQTYGLGTVENLSLVGLINGVFDIRQSDIVSINDGREYEVQYPPTWFDAFTMLQLTQRDQITQATTL